jgi:hypothetical protein
MRMTRDKLSKKMFSIVTDLQQVTGPSKIHLALIAAGELHELARRISPEHGNESVDD